MWHLFIFFCLRLTVFFHFVLCKELLEKVEMKTHLTSELQPRDLTLGRVKHVRMIMDLQLIFQMLKWLNSSFIYQC